MRGKILNVERARFDRMVSSNDIRNMITALGPGIGPAGAAALKMENLRYHKVVIMTDADVDGAHIRTLLLTFFYRQMPELIERGHLYIAQPPLYGVKSGKQDIYLKNETEMRAFTMKRYLDDRTLSDTAGNTLKGEELMDFITTLTSFRDQLDRINHRGFPQAIWPHLFKAHTDDEGGFMSLEWTRRLAEALKADGLEIEGPVAPQRPEPTEGEENGHDEDSHHLEEVGYKLLVTSAHNKYKKLTLNRDLLASETVKKLFGLRRKIDSTAVLPYTIGHKEKSYQIDSEDALINDMETAGQKGLRIQRYKGLGEMNPSQLWETTMDPERRTFLQVKVSDAMEADDIFTVLMGDKVEPRRDFIQENALNVRELDV